MALWNFTCPTCGYKKRKIMSRLGVFLCGKCNTEMVVKDSKLTNQNKEVIDSGWMGKAIERHEGVEQIMQEWADTDGGSKSTDPDDDKIV